MPPKAAKWEWENDSSAFAAFDADANRIIEDLFQRAAGAGTARATMPSGFQYTFDFDNMTQTNRETKKVRNLRRFGPAVAADGAAGGDAAPATTTSEADAAPAAAATTTHVGEVVPPAPILWRYRDDTGAFQPCDASATAMLEAKYQAAFAAKTHLGETKIGAWNYELNFATMQQTNQKTKKARDLHRLGGPSSADHTDSFKSFAAPATTGGDDEDDDLGTGAEPPAKKKRVETASGASVAVVTSSGGGASAGASGGSAGAQQQGGGAPKYGSVDPHSGLADRAKVLKDGAILWQTMLNQTNLGLNNNKFYVIQLLVDDKRWYVFTRWGRVGVPGQTALDTFTNVDSAKSYYCSKFRDKTKNDWTSVASGAAAFTKYDGKYQMMDIVVSGSAAVADLVEEEMHALESAVSSHLPPQVQAVMRMISDKASFDRTMKDLEYDAKKLPLGQLSKKQIKQAFEHLKTIENELKKARPSSTKLVDESSMFYTLIPHDTGFSLPPVIRDEELLKKKMDMLEALSDIEIASGLLKEVKRTGIHPLDTAYGSLKCKMAPLDHSSPEFLRIVDYVNHTHGKTHTAYKLQVDDVLLVEREGESLRYEHTSAGLRNKMLLWHGSRTTNFMGILSQGLRIAPPEAPVTGYMYGKGVYFADVATKSGNYCHTSPSNNRGLLLLCEVALGDMAKFTAAKYMDTPMPGTQSTMGVGKMEPNPAEGETVDGVFVPKGRMHDTPGVADSALLYHEYIVYDTAQLKMKYLVSVTFNYGKR